jgi:hypothetical protein
MLNQQAFPLAFLILFYLFLEERAKNEPKRREKLGWLMGSVETAAAAAAARNLSPAREEGFFACGM